MPHVPTPDVNLQVENLIAMLNKISLQQDATTQTGACLYNAGGKTTCCVTTETWCVQGLKGSYIGGTCTGEHPEIPNEEVDEVTIARLVGSVNRANALLPHPAPLGICTYPSVAGEATIETTQACAFALMGDFLIGEPEPELARPHGSAGAAAHA